MRKKRIPYIFIDDLSEVKVSDKPNFLFLVSTSESHITKIVRECQFKKIHPIVISLQQINKIPGIYSSVTPNIEQSMLKIMKFLKNNNKKAPALYGISINSAPDLARKKHFFTKANFNKRRRTYLL